jgi:radical SAM protein with 4Fe4S-binding SPASM domain
MNPVLDKKSLLEGSVAFCMLPWTHMSVDPSGTVTPCCVSGAALDDLGKSTLESAWNSDGMRKLRYDMLAGRKNPACAACHARDEAGSPSLRRWANRRFRHHFPRVVGTTSAGGVAELNMPYLDIRFSNLCNFSCRICSPDLSTGWYQDAEKLDEPIATARTLRPTSDPRDLWRRLEPLLPRVEEIRFQGGEPLIMKEHYRILDALLERRRTGVVLRYNTNFQ